LLYRAKVHSYLITWEKTKKTDLHAHPQRVYASEDDANNLKIQGYLVENGIEGCRGEKRGTLFPSTIF